MNEHLESKKWVGIDDGLSKQDDWSGAIYDDATGEFLFRVPPEYRRLIVSAVNAYGHSLTFKDAVAIAKGCFDYGGGYRADDDKLAIFHHGIQTVINALESATKSGLSDLQTAVLHQIGSSDDLK